MNRIKKEEGKNFLYNLGNSSFFNFDNFIQFSELSSSTEQNTNILPLNKQKNSCYTCYKIILCESSIFFLSKFFCSEECKIKFSEMNLVNIFFIYFKIFRKIVILKIATKFLKKIKHFLRINCISVHLNV